MRANGLTAYVGPPGGYVVKFSNDLVAYLSGDTGITAEQEQVVRRFYKANLAVINIGGTFTTARWKRPMSSPIWSSPTRSSPRTPTKW